MYFSHKCFNYLIIKELILSMEKILQNIKSIRLQKAFSQEYMAEKLLIEQASYGLIENGKRKLKYETLEQIAIIFEVNVIDIITYPSIYVRAENVTLKSPKITLQIDLEDNVKADVIKLTFGDRAFEIKNN